MLINIIQKTAKVSQAEIYLKWKGKKKKKKTKKKKQKKNKKNFPIDYATIVWESLASSVKPCNVIKGGTIL